MNVTTAADENATTAVYVASQRDMGFYITVTIIVIAGSVGNIISFFMFLLRPNLRNLPVSVYICGLAVVDTGALWIVNGGRYWAKSIFKTNIPGAGSMCNVFWFASPTFSAASAWISVVMTFDRIIAVFFPLKYKVTLISYSENIYGYIYV